VKITAIRYYGGARERLWRLGLAALLLEVQELLLQTEIRLLEKLEANGAAVIREAIDEGFMKRGGWKKKPAGGIDWTKRFQYNESVIAKLGVEVQVSARSDLLTRDIVHLRNSLKLGEIDAGLIVVSSDRTQQYLTDRTPSLADALRIIEVEFRDATDYPIVLMAVEHDGPTDKPLPKKTTNRGKAR
jgi:hypothetical protein